MFYILGIFHEIMTINNKVTVVYIVICCALLCVHSSFAIILMGKRELVTLHSVSSRCLMIFLLCDSSSRCHGFVCSL